MADLVWRGGAIQRAVANLVREGSTGWLLALLVPGWLHGRMGLNVAFRHRLWYRRFKPWLIGVVIALPLLAALGYWSMIGEVTALLASPPPKVVTVDPAQRQSLNDARGHLLDAYFALLGLVLVSRSWRDWKNWRNAKAGFA